MSYNHDHRTERTAPNDGYEPTLPDRVRQKRKADGMSDMEHKMTVSKHRAIEGILRKRIADLEDKLHQAEAKTKRKEAIIQRFTDENRQLADRDDGRYRELFESFQSLHRSEAGTDVEGQRGRGDDGSTKENESFRKFFCMMDMVQLLLNGDSPGCSENHESKL